MRDDRSFKLLKGDHSVSFVNIGQFLQLQQPQLYKTDNQQSSGKDHSKSVEEHQQPDECSDEDGEIVPVVVRPGHIRFEPFDKGNCYNQKSDGELLLL